MMFFDPEFDDLLEKITKLPRSKRLAVIYPIIVEMLQQDFPQVPKNVINNVIREIMEEVSDKYVTAQLEFSFVEKTIDRIFKVIQKYE